MITKSMFILLESLNFQLFNILENKMNRGIVFLPCHYSGGRKCRPQGSACEVTGQHPEQNLIPAQRHTPLTDKEVSRVVRSCYTSKKTPSWPQGLNALPSFHTRTCTHTVRFKGLSPHGIQNLI